jgi:hypothetical protein
MNIKDLGNSRFTAAGDCDPPMKVTASHVEQMNVAPADQKPQMKWVLNFKEPDVKPLVLNKTNGESIARITGSDDSDDWTGAVIVLYYDPNVSFGGKLVGGIRVRAPKKPTPPHNPAGAVRVPRPPSLDASLAEIDEAAERAAAEEDESDIDW